MIFDISKRVSCAILGLLVAGTPHFALAQSYPAKPIHVVVPLGPGSSGDILARLVGESISVQTGQQTIVENKPGAEGIIGVQAVSSAPPDGYTVLVTTSSTQVLNIHLYKKLSYDPVNDFRPVAPLVLIPLMLNVGANSEYKDAQQLIAAAKQNPGKVKFGSAAATQRIAGEMFQQQAGVKLLNVPYRSTAAALTDLVSGQIDIVFTDLASIRSFQEAKTVVPLATTISKRLASLPDVPTLQEVGLQSYEIGAWFGVWVPAGTPDAIVARLNTLVSTAMKSKPASDLAKLTGLEPFFLSAEDFAKFQADEIRKFGEAVKAAGIEPQ